MVITAKKHESLCAMEIIFCCMIEEERNELEKGETERTVSFYCLPMHARTQERVVERARRCVVRKQGNMVQLRGRKTSPTYKGMHVHVREQGREARSNVVAYDPRRHQGMTLRRRRSQHPRASSPLDK